MSEQDHVVPSKREDVPLPYQDYPLNPHTLSIRLLKLEPAVSWTDEICCSLTVVNLQACPQFEALSYTWDGGFATESIKLSNTPYLVTSNLKSFLLHRRSDVEAINLWVDAVCINQSSHSEKSSQVRMMNMIYATAAKLMVWLGPEADESSLAMEELLRLGAGSPYDKMPILSGSVLTAVKKLLTRGWWSRIWIIQEVVWGGLGRKVQDIRVRCGTKEIWWVNLVIAAARMQAHMDDQRQHYPAIGNILRLEEVRNQDQSIVDNSIGNEIMVMNLVALHRHFQATDPRDKIYALMGMVFGESRRPYPRVKIDYSMNTREIYVAFATMLLQNGPGLDILRHCHSPVVEILPSWVPDWSIGRVEKPLPSRKSSRYEKEPWGFALKHSSKDGSVVQDSPAFIEEGPGKGLQLNIGLPGDIQTNTIPRSWADVASPEILAKIKTLMDTGRLVVVSTNDAGEDEVVGSSGHKNIKDVEERILKRSERITRQNTESKNQTFSAGPVVRYAAAGDTTAKVFVDQTTNTLEVEGLLFDIVSQTHEPFVDNVDTEWENSTHFMVAIGHCKQLALSEHIGQNPYVSLEARVEAFWLTLFAGRRTNNLGAELSIDKMPFHEWLPRIPNNWIPASPRVTVVNTGRLKTGELGKAMESAIGELRRMNPGSDFEIELPGARMLNNLRPEEWADEDFEYHSTRFQQLGSIWLQQPFDLYHRPFALPTVVPDPFWETRQREDKVALSRLKTQKLEGILGYDNSSGLDEQPWDPRQWVEEALKKEVPVVPKDTLDPGFENFALGRRFFITRKGYLGLGPSDTKVGDRVSVLLGSDVPFILRKREGASREGWEMVGETYVHGIMGGEVIEKWKMGHLEVGKLVLH